jgi:hypothetical protein
MRRTKLSPPIPLAVSDETILDELELPLPGQHASFMGNSGEGKTAVACVLFDAVDHGIVINSKHDPLFARLCDRTIRNDGAILKVRGGRYNYEPSDAFNGVQRGLDPAAALRLAFQLRNRFFDWALTKGHRVIYIDEFNEICPSASLYPLQFQKAVKQGRWRELSIWGSAQEPIRVPSFAFGQSKHRYLFYLGWPSHRRLAEEWYQRPIQWDRIPEGSHKFYVKTPSGVYGPQPRIKLPSHLISER